MWDDALQSCTKLNTYGMKTEQCEVGGGVGCVWMVGVLYSGKYQIIATYSVLIYSLEISTTTK